MSDYNFEFFEEDGSVKLKWVYNSAEKFSNDLSKFVKKQRWNDERPLSSNQLRNFYNEFLRIRDLPSDDKSKLVQIKLLVAKVKYKKTNSPRDMKQIFVDFITELVEQIGDSIEKFNNSCLIMEAVVGFFPKNK